ncbi:hypothetical protein IG631_07549 [Alternaria alternata]|nr:hypothetical protein IG631_07549 [Alternaria alternata]
MAPSLLALGESMMPGICCSLSRFRLWVKAWLDNVHAMMVPRRSLSVGKSAGGSARAHRLQSTALTMGADVKARAVSYSMVLSPFT